MAIQVTLTGSQTSVGCDCAAAYGRIVGVNFNGLTGRVDVAVNVYYNRGARDMGKSPVMGGVYSCKWYSNEITGDQGRGDPVDPVVDALPTVSGLNLPALYTFLQTLPDFSGGSSV